jgi:hypothetical protein
MQLIDEGSFTQFSKNLLNNQIGMLNQILTGSADVAPLVGYNLIESTGVDAITLALPLKGSPLTGGQDGFVVAFFDNGGHAHTITLPSAGFSTSAGKKTVATFNGTINSVVELLARNGLWLVSFSTGVAFA